jgi:uncharacterized protein YegL
MKKDLTELVFILDKSGSMSGLESDTIGGFNSMLDKQQKKPGEALVTTVLFDNNYCLLHDRVTIKKMKPITDKQYYVEGSTALLDAVGKTINKISNAHKNTADDERPEKTMFVIITDGMENASVEYSYRKVKAMVELQKAEFCWEFIFLGANIDAAQTAARFGVNVDRAVNYHADSDGLKTSYDAVTCAVSEMRANKNISGKWRKDIDEDFNSRK